MLTLENFPNLFQLSSIIEGWRSENRYHPAEPASMRETDGRRWWFGICRVRLVPPRNLRIVGVKQGGLELVNDNETTFVVVFSPGAEHFQPKQIVKSLIPSWNTLVFFEVSPVSFHQVTVVNHKYIECKDHTF